MARPRGLSLPTDFKRSGSKALDRKPFAVKLPPELAEYVRALANKNQWLIEAVAEKVARELDSNQCQHNYIPYWQALDALVMRCKDCGFERSPTTDELTAVLGTVLSVRSDYQHQALNAGKRSRREELEQAVDERDRQIEYLKGRLGN